MQSVIEILVFAGPPLLAAGAAFGGVRMSLNGMGKTINRIETKVDRIDEQTQDNRVEIAALKKGAEYAE